MAHFSDQFRQEDSSMAFRSTGFNQNVQGRRIDVFYNNDILVGIDFDGGKKEKGLRIWKSASGDQIPLDDLLTQGPVEVTRDGGIYKATYDDKNKSIIIERRQGSELKDKLSIQTNIASHEVFNDLFPSELMEDPLGADCELDDAWKTTSPESFGTKWARIA